MVFVGGGCCLGTNLIYAIGVLAGNNHQEGKNQKSDLFQFKLTSFESQLLRIFLRISSCWSSRLPRLTDKVLSPLVMTQSRSLLWSVTERFGP